MRSSYSIQNIRKYSSLILIFLSYQKAISTFLLYIKAISFRVSLVNSIAILEQSLINYQLKFRNIRKDYITLTFLGRSYSLTTYIFSSLIRTPSAPTMYLRNATSLLQNSHFSSFSQRLNLLRHLSTYLIYSTCSSLVLEQIRILSKYVITKISRYALNTLLISSQNITRAFVSLNSIIVYLQCLYLVQNAVFYSSPFLILIRQYLSCRLRAVKTFT